MFVTVIVLCCAATVLMPCCPQLLTILDSVFLMIIVAMIHCCYTTQYDQDGSGGSESELEDLSDAALEARHTAALLIMKKEHEQRKAM